MLTLPQPDKLNKQIIHIMICKPACCDIYLFLQSLKDSPFVLSLPW